MILELIEDDYLIQHIVCDYKNRRVLKEKQQFEFKKRYYTYPLKKQPNQIMDQLIHVTEEIDQKQQQAPHQTSQQYFDARGRN